jgi:hypothetical protein
LQICERGSWIVDEAKELKVGARDHAVAHEGVEVEDLLSVARAVQQRRYRAAQLARLRQREDVGQLVERAEAARELRLSGDIPTTGLALYRETLYDSR